MAPPTTDALIVGCGYLGRRVAARWLAAGRRVAALTRRNAETLAALGIEPILGDVLDPGSLKQLPRARTLLHAIALDRTTGKTMREVHVHGLGNILEYAPRPQRFIHIASTGVYGQVDGSWVDEPSATEPVEESGRIVLEAEALLRSKRPDAIILRFAGIYGPDRLLRKQAILKGEPLLGDAERWLNLIHVDDGAAAVIAAEAKGVPDETYNVADDAPATRRDFYTRLAELLGAPPARFESRPEAGSANRRVSNRKARELLGWTPRFPTYREGLADAVSRSNP
jgi:nucleoside-diphosphate-sugar epimerase